MGMMPGDPLPLDPALLALVEGFDKAARHPLSEPRRYQGAPDTSGRRSIMPHQLDQNVAPFLAGTVQ